MNYDVSWGTHITENTAKANRTLELVKRVCRDLEDITIRKYLYISLVRSQLEYSPKLWSASGIKYKRMLEDVQRRATKFILSYPSGVSYKEKLTKLRPNYKERLELRRKIRMLIRFI